MKITTILLTLLLAVSTTATAEFAFGTWQVFKSVDDFTSVVSVSASRSDIIDDGYGGSDWQSFGLRCLDNDLLMTFEAGENVSYGGATVAFYVKVDNNKAVKFAARIYRNSYKSGYVVILANDPIIQQLKAGNIAKIRVDSRRDIIDWTMNLKGYTAAVNQVIASCK